MLELKKYFLFLRNRQKYVCMLKRRQSLFILQDFGTNCFLTEPGRLHPGQ